MRQAKNKVFIEGILSENNLKEGSYTKNGATMETIHGDIKILVKNTINGVPIDNEIPVYVFANKFKNNGEPNPAYESLARAMTEYQSIASTGSIDTADCVRITSGDIRMNEYFDQNGRFISFPRINTSFISRITKKDEMKPKAEFDVEFVVAEQGYEIDANGENVKDQFGNDKYYVKGIIVGYNDTLNICKFYCANKNVMDAVHDFWTEGDTVPAHGRLNFTSTTIKEKIQSGFGEPIENSRTVSVSDLVITGGDNPLDETLAYDAADIQNALANRKARLEADREKAKNKPATKAAPSPMNNTGAARKAMDLGF